MDNSDSHLGQEGSPSWFQSVKTVLALLASGLHTRLELFVTELEEERERLKHTLILTALVVLGLGFGFILFTIFLVALFWAQGWIVAIGGLALLYFVIAIIAGLKLRSAILRRPGLFPATLAELGKDRDQLRSSGRE